MYCKLKNIVYFSFFTTCLLFQSCIGDEESNCHYDDGVQLLLTYTPDENSEHVMNEYIKQFNIYVFDELGYFVNLIHDEINEDFRSNERLEKFYVPGGRYSFVTWADDNSGFCTLSDMIKGVSRIEDLKLKVKRGDNGRIDYRPTSLFHSDVLNTEIKEGVVNEITTSLIQNTNTITVNMLGLSHKYAPDQIYASITLRDGEYRYDNSVVPNSPVMVYEPLRYEPVEDGRAAVFQTFRLTGEDVSRLEIVARSATPASRSETEKILYEANLIRLIKKNPNLNIDTMHDFTIDLNFEGASLVITVNGWELHESDQGI